MDKLKGQCHVIFASDFFHESSSPNPDDTGDKFATGINDTGSKFATGVNEKFSDWRFFPFAIPIFGKIRNGPNGIIRGLAETDPCRTPEVENLVALSI
jgi:hypothetical protein